MKIIEWSTTATKERGIEPQRGWMDDDGNVYDKHWRSLKRTDDNELEAVEVDPSVIKSENFLFIFQLVGILAVVIYAFASFYALEKEWKEEKAQREMQEKEREERRRFEW